MGRRLMVVDVLAANPGATIIADVKASQVLFDQVAEMGGKPLMWRTGHSLIKAKMAETGALLSGERTYFLRRPVLATMSCMPRCACWRRWPAATIRWPTSGNPCLSC